MKPLFSIAVIALFGCQGETDRTDSASRESLSTKTLTCAAIGQSEVVSVVEVTPSESFSQTLTIEFDDGAQTSMTFDGNITGPNVGFAINYRDRGSSPQPRATFHRVVDGDGKQLASLSYDIDDRRGLVALTCDEATEEEAIDTLDEFSKVVDRYADCVRSGDFLEVDGPVKVSRNFSRKKLAKEAHKDLVDVLDFDEDEYDFETEDFLQEGRGQCSDLAETIQARMSFARAEGAQHDSTEQFRHIRKFKVKVEGDFFVYTVITGHDGE